MAAVAEGADAVAAEDDAALDRASLGGGMPPGSGTLAGDVKDGSVPPGEPFGPPGFRASPRTPR
jgi:hypothetical protein